MLTDKQPRRSHDTSLEAHENTLDVTPKCYEISEQRVYLLSLFQETTKTFLSFSRSFFFFFLLFCPVHTLTYRIYLLSSVFTSLVYSKKQQKRSFLLSRFRSYTQHINPSYLPTLLGRCNHSIKRPTMYKRTLLQRNILFLTLLRI